jgi:hypothetical protein
MAFDRNVFVNCPFDEAYLPLLRPILFVTLYLGLTPRIALENLDSGRPRIEKIIALIEQSKYAVHDLSRMQAERAGEYYRLNMPSSSAWMSGAGCSKQAGPQKRDA